MYEFCQDADIDTIYGTFFINAKPINANNDYDGYGGGRCVDDIDCVYYQQFRLNPYTELGLEDKY